MMDIRRAETRGFFDFGWLRTHHTFSFGDYYDPSRMGFRTLRVINEDRIAPGQGFGMHPHRDMEIVTYMVGGALTHRDSLGNTSRLEAGEIQRMSAGEGVIHSEMNGEPDFPAELLQIWIRPTEMGIPPAYEQKPFPPEERRNAWKPLVTPDGRDGSLLIHQDATISGALLDPGRELPLGAADGRGLWVQIVSGELEAAGETLRAGDGAAIEGVPDLTLKATEDSEVLVFDLA